MGDWLRRLDERLGRLDERMVWVDVPRPTLTPGATLLLGLLAICVYVGWALTWSWPAALLGVAALIGGVVAVAKFWFAAPRS